MFGLWLQEFLLESFDRKQMIHLFTDLAVASSTTGVCNGVKLRTWGFGFGFAGVC